MKIFRRWRSRLKNVIDLISHLSLQETISVIRGESVLLVYYRSKSGRNFGDDISPIIFTSLTGLKVAYWKAVLNIMKKPRYYFMGSIIEGNLNNSIIVGSGIIKEDQRVSGKPEVLVVRGPLTRRILINTGINCPEIYGDPGLLVPMVFKRDRTSTKEVDVCIVPHYVDKEHVKENIFIEPGGLSYRIVDIQDDFEKVINSICSCKYVLSSSLHGIITAHAYGVPAVWLEFSEKVIGRGFKFRDYFYSVDLPVVGPIRIGQKLTLEKVIDFCSLPKKQIMKECQENLLKALNEIKHRENIKKS